MPAQRDFMDRIIEKGILFLLIFTPLAFGAVQPWAVAVIEIIAFTLFSLHLIQKTMMNTEGASGQCLSDGLGSGSRPRFLSVMGRLFVLLMILALFQMLPLPENILKVVSPAALSTWRDFGSFPAGTYHPISINPDATRQELFRLLGYAAVFILIISRYRSKDQVNSLVKMILFMAFFLVVFAVIQKATWNGRVFWIFPVDDSIGDRIWGTYINRDHFAGYLEMAIPLAMGMLLYRAPRVPTLPGDPLGRRISRFMSSENFTSYALLFLLVLMLAAALFMTFSRGGILAFVFSSVFFAWITYRRRSLNRQTGFLALLSVGVFAVVVLASWDRLEEKFAELDKAHVGRLTVWTDAIGIMHDYPLVGTGLGTFKNAYMRYQSSMPQLIFDHAHNDYVELFTDTGAVGFVLVMGMGLIFFWHAFRRWRHKHSQFGKCIGAGGLSSLAAMSLHSFVDFNLHIPANALLFVVIAGITYAAIFNVSDRHSKSYD